MKGLLCQALNVTTKILNNLSLISPSALAKRIKQHSQVRLEDNMVLTAKQIQELQKRMLNSKKKILS